MLDNISFKCSVRKSTNDLKVDDNILSMVISDARTYETVIKNMNLLDGYTYRVKTPDSIERKIKRYPDRKFQSVFNDILDIRLIVKDYNIKYPDYFRVVDMTSGKKEDDGYRAIHLYYKLDNYHYQIEIQLWSESDYNFNLWSHAYAYKSLDKSKLKEIHNLYCKGVIKTELDFKRETDKYGV